MELGSHNFHIADLPLPVIRCQTPTTLFMRSDNVNFAMPAFVSVSEFIRPLHKWEELTKNSFG